LSPEVLYDSLDRELTNGAAHDFLYSGLYAFVGYQYEGDLLTACLAYEHNFDPYKISLSYNDAKQLIQITEYSEDEKSPISIIDFEYQNGQVSKITRMDYASNWKNRITDKTIIEYVYDNGIPQSITYYTWDSFRWDNDFYENTEPEVKTYIIK